MKKIEKIIPYAILFVMFVLIAFSFRDNPFSKVLSGHDSSMFLYFGRGISDGLVPYKDMLDHKGPFLFIIEYMAILIGFGNISMGIWIVECLFLLGSIIFLFKTSCLYVESKLVSSVALAFMTPIFILCYDGGNYSEEFALLFISISFYLFSKAVLQKNVSQLEYVLIGICGAATFFIRINMISLWVVFCLVVLFENLFNKRINLLLKQIRGIFIGGVLVVSIMVILSLFQNNLREMIQQAFIMNFLYSDSNISEKITVAYSFIDLLLKTGIFPMIVIGCAYFFVDNKKIQNKVIIILLIYFIMNFFTVILSGRYYTHYLITQFVPIAIFLAFSIDFITLTLVKRRKKIFTMMLLLTMVLPSSVLAIKNYNWRFSIDESMDVKQTRSIANYIEKNSSPKETIYVHNINANIYLLSNRYSNSRFFVLPAVNYENFNELKKEFSRELQSNPPKYIVIRKQFLEDKYNKSNLNNEVYSVLEKNYHQNKNEMSDYYLLYEINK
ncbi:prepilin-type cleavage/methylation protein [Enterococcus viikkiensis]|uniref:Prepilin-type cleavage/methylation protein n=1 Tax=Enterococcus viikkiensis TaxID=930854 RepID=A0ABU3FNH9_9ENTE|nr:prepilin-type cleavage/methylation protein [Enterococcus viikkiensis]MDT2827525.1 prepilin-type cleavage/methylation protein [Enterococcus viikkiensis]